MEHTCIDPVYRGPFSAIAGGLDNLCLAYLGAADGLARDSMVALKIERRVFLWRMRPHCEPSDANKSVTLAEIIAILESELKAGRARAYLSGTSRFIEDDDDKRDEKNQLYLAEIKHNKDSGTVTILVNRGDPNTVATAYLDTGKNTVRIEPPKKHEAPGFSAHLIFSVAPDKGQFKGKHKAVFEQMPKVSSSLVMNLLNRVLARAVDGDTKYTYMVEVKSKTKIGSRPKPYRPALDVRRVPSERLVDDLEKGELSGVTLTKRATFYNGPGRDGVVRYQEQKMTLHTAPADATAVRKFLKGLEGWAKEKSYESITFHLENLPHNQTNNPTIVLDDEDALEQLYVRAQILSGFNGFLEACYPAVCDEIEEKMISVVNGNHGW